MMLPLFYSSPLMKSMSLHRTIIHNKWRMSSKKQKTFQKYTMMHTKNKYSDTIILYCIFLFGILVKLVLLICEPTLSRDSTLYLNLAEIWYDTDSYQAMINASEISWLPLLPIVIYKYSMCYNSEALCIAVNIFLGSLIPFLGYKIALELFRKRNIAFVTAILLEFNPKINSISIEVQRDIFYLFFFGLFLLFLILTLKRKRCFYIIICSIISSCSLLTRFEGVELILIFVISIAFMFVTKRTTMRKAFSLVVIYLVSIIASLSLLSVFSPLRINNVISNYYSYCLNAKNKVVDSDG